MVYEMFQNYVSSPEAMCSGPISWEATLELGRFGQASQSHEQKYGVFRK